VGEFVPYLNNIIKPLHYRLKKNLPSWSNLHTQTVKDIKLKVQSIKCLYLPILQAFKIVEIDGSDIGYGGILKQRVHDQEHVIAYTSKHWNPAQLKYSTIKKEVLAIVLCISKFQSNLLNQKFLIKVYCKSAKDILQKDVKNLASKAPQTLCLITLPVNSYRKAEMPPKAVGTSLMDGRSSSKSLNLALLEPTTKTKTNSSRSPTQVGSSTQKIKKEGSSTQIISVKPESSTQETPKPATAKQTSANYAWSVETL